MNEFGSNVDRHRRELLVHCYRMLGSLPDAEDAVQETLLRAWRYRDSLKEGAPPMKGDVTVQDMTIVKGHSPVEHPAVISIRPADPSFVFEDFSSREAGPPLGQDPLDILGVNEGCPIPAGDFVQSDAQVFQPRLIEVFEITVGPGCVNQRRNRVKKELGIQTLGSLS